MSIQEKLDALSPFVTTIRYSERPIVDIAFPPSWGLPESTKIKVTLILEGSSDDISRYMVYGIETEKVDVDELLDYMTVSIRLNKEREAKKSMLNEKISELTTLFDKTSLSKLKKLTFTFEEPSVPTISLGTIDEEEEFIQIDGQLDEGTNEVEIDETHPLGWTKDDVEANDKLQKEERETEEPRTFTTDNGQKVDLPPKKKEKEKIEVEVLEGATCKCGEGEMCPECTDF